MTGVRVRVCYVVPAITVADRGANGAGSAPEVVRFIATASGPAGSLRRGFSTSGEAGAWVDAVLAGARLAGVIGTQNWVGTWWRDDLG